MTVPTGGIAPNVTRSAWLALRALGERLAVLPTAASIGVPVAPPAAAPAPAAVAPINLLDLSSAGAVRDDRGRRLLRDAAWQRSRKCHRAGGYGRPTKEQSAPRKAQSIHTKCTFQHVKIPSLGLPTQQECKRCHECTLNRELIRGNVRTRTPPQELQPHRP